MRGSFGSGKLWQSCPLKPESWGGLGLQQVLRCRSPLGSGSILLTMLESSPFSLAGSAFVSSASLLFPSAPASSGCCSASSLPLFIPLASSLLSDSVLCLVSAELPSFFSLSQLCSTAEGREPSKVKAARDHVKAQRLSWGRSRFARCLHVLSLYVTVLRPVLCYGNSIYLLLCGKTYFSRKL